MKKIIKLTESDLSKIVLIVLKEQGIRSYTDTKPTSDYLGKGGQFERNTVPHKLRINFLEYHCLPSGIQGFANYVSNNKQKLMKDLGVDVNTFTLIAKAAMAIIGRESSFGKGTEFTDDAVEFLFMLGLGFIPRGVQTGYNQVRSMIGKNPQSISLGPAQFTEDTWVRYGLDKKIGPYGENIRMISQGIATMHRINEDYKKAIETGNGNGPSVNPIATKQGKITKINGTGNNALDLAIVSHNMPDLIKKWCQTNNPNYAGPCDQQVYLPFPETKKDLKLTVYQDKPILNYFPNKKSGMTTSIGYLEEVVGYIDKFKCFTI